MDNFNYKKFLAEGRLLNEDEGQFAAEEKALGTLFHPNPDQEDAEYSPYVYDEEAFINLIKDMGYSDYKEVASEFLHYFSPADEDELRILRHNERNPELQPTDLTVGMYTRNIQKEFPKDMGRSQGKLHENSPGFEGRKYGESLPTLKSIQSAYESKQISEEEEVAKAPKKEVKKPKKDSVDNKLAEIDKEGQIVALEAKIEAIDEMIESKNQRISMVTEDDNLSQLVDKKKMKEMQREVKDLERRKAKMEKLYEKMCGKSYTKEEMVDEEMSTEVDEEMSNELNEGKTTMKKSELKEMIKKAMLSEDPITITNTTDAYDPLYEEDLEEVSLNASELETAIAALSGILGLPAVAYLSQLAQDKLEDIKSKLAEGDNYYEDSMDEAEDVEVNKILSSGGYDEIDDEELLATVKGRLKGKSNIGAKALNLLIMKIEDEEGGNIDFTNEAEEVEVEDNEEVDVDIEKDVKIDDESVESDIEVDASMPGESADEVAVQSLLMKAQEEAAKLGDEKLTDQIGNTITYFTRAHVAQVDENKRLKRSKVRKSLKESKVRRGEDGLITKLL